MKVHSARTPGRRRTGRRWTTSTGGRARSSGGSPAARSGWRPPGPPRRRSGCARWRAAAGARRPRPRPAPRSRAGPGRSGGRQPGSRHASPDRPARTAGRPQGCPHDPASSSAASMTTSSSLSQGAMSARAAPRCPGPRHLFIPFIRFMLFIHRPLSSGGAADPRTPASAARTWALGYVPRDQRPAEEEPPSRAIQETQQRARAAGATSAESRNGKSRVRRMVCVRGRRGGQEVQQCDGQPTVPVNPIGVALSRRGRGERDPLTWGLLSNGEWTDPLNPFPEPLPHSAV